jgi:serine phosphatase RsbU (regulator of sigma subunit)/signal transduction histidine kinase
MNVLSRLKRMKIKRQIFLTTVSIIIISTLITIALSVYSIKKGEWAEIAEYRKEELRKVEQRLKNAVDIAYATLDANYSQARDTRFLEKRYGPRLMDIVDQAEAIVKEKAALVREGRLTPAKGKAQAMAEIRKIRYDRGTGYVWINDTGRPYPKMIMHATTPSLDGKVLDAPQFNCALGKGKNLFQAFVEITDARGEGFVDYHWPKPVQGKLTEPAAKLSYGRLFKEWGWIIGTGVYVDDAITDALEKSKADIRQMRYDQDTGYFWINDMGRPYPRMIMHATDPSLDGKVLDAPQFNCALGKGKNLFQAFVEITDARGEGFVDYQWPKPVQGKLTEPVAKLSYGRLYKPLGWMIGTGAYVDNIEEEINGKIAAMNEQINHLIGLIILLSAGIVAAAMVASLYTANSLANPIKRLIAAMQGIQQEGLSGTRVDLNGAEEVAKLGDIFNGMLASVEQAVKELTETTAAKERIESELTIARQIQMNILPRIFPAFPDRPEFDIYAVIEPAREVGGDFYDFFQIDPTHLCFVMADVSGKGIPASLFMAVTKTLIKAVAGEDARPEVFLAKVNNELARGNEASMFVTVFCGILDTETGEVVYANAGHNPPLLIRREGSVAYLDGTAGLVLGAFEGITYAAERLILGPGDSLFLYTDGVTEAMDREQALFSEERLQQELDGLKEKPIKEMTHGVLARVKLFSEGIPQSDDIAMMVVQYRGQTPAS